MIPAKEVVRRLRELLPDDASLEDIQSPIYVRHTILRGLEDIEAGRTRSEEKFEARSRPSTATSPSSAGWGIPRRLLQCTRAVEGVGQRTGVTERRNTMQIVDSQIHLWENARMSPQHRQIPTYSMNDALQEMAEAGVDAAVLHPPSTLGEAVNVLAVEAARQHPEKFCILGNFDLLRPDRLDIVKHWRQRPGMLGFRFTFNQPHQQSWWTDGSLDWF